MKSTFFLVGALLLAGLSSAQNPKPAVEGQKPAATKSAYQTKAAFYPLNTCVVSGEELEGDEEPVTFEAGGRTFRTCCKKCMGKVQKAPEDFVKKLDAAVIAQQLPTYPLGTCPVSGEKLGGMGEPTQVVLDGTLVQLCCPKCVKKATADSAAMAQKVRDAAFTAQMAKYPLKTCPVSGKELGADAVNTMFGTTLVRTCCEKCVAAIEKDPAKYMSKMTAAPAAGKDAAGGKEAKEKKGDGGKDGESCCGGDGACCGNCAPPASVGAKAGEKKADCCEGEKAKTDAKKTDKPAPKEPEKKAN
jgi:hypothetical protein